MAKACRLVVCFVVLSLLATTLQGCGQQSKKEPTPNDASSVSSAGDAPPKSLVEPPVQGPPSREPLSPTRPEVPPEDPFVHKTCSISDLSAVDMDLEGCYEAAGGFYPVIHELLLGGLLECLVQCKNGFYPVIHELKCVGLEEPTWQLGGMSSKTGMSLTKGMKLCEPQHCPVSDLKSELLCLKGEKPNVIKETGVCKEAKHRFSVGEVCTVQCPEGFTRFGEGSGKPMPRCIGWQEPPRIASKPIGRWVRMSEEEIAEIQAEGFVQLDVSTKGGAVGRQQPRKMRKVGRHLVPYE